LASLNRTIKTGHWSFFVSPSAGFNSIKGTIKTTLIVKTLPGTDVSIP